MFSTSVPLNNERLGVDDTQTKRVTILARSAVKHAPDIRDANLRQVHDQTETLHLFRSQIETRPYVYWAMRKGSW